jgi:hypothetical protein
LLADLVVKLDLRFPYLIDKRINAVKEIAERPGYSDYKQELDAVCDELSRYDNLRHFMVHGFMSMETDKHGDHRFELHRYHREGEGNFTLLSGTTDIERLRGAVADIGDYVSHVVRLFERIYREKKLYT